jgi:hypothetical protein
MQISRRGFLAAVTVAPLLKLATNETASLCGSAQDFVLHLPENFEDAPQTFTVGYEVFKALKNHPDLVDVIRYKESPECQ